MGGPKSWNGAKRRAKRPGSNEAVASQKQNVGRLARMNPTRPEPAIQKQQQKKSRPKELQKDEKRLRALNKLLRSIEDLQQREAAGEVLDAQQQQKVDRLDEVLAELEELMGVGE